MLSQTLAQGFDSNCRPVTCAMGTMHVFTEVLLWLLCMGCLVNSKKWVGGKLATAIIYIFFFYKQHFLIHFNPFKPQFTIVIFIHYKPRIAVAILDL